MAPPHSRVFSPPVCGFLAAAVGLVPFALCVAAASNLDTDVAAAADREIPSLVAMYTDLHRHPELSHFETRTSSVLAAELRRAGFEVTEHVGRYPNGSRAYGVVAVLRNGPGPTLMVRSDMDALPVEEKTGLAYASTARMKNDAGTEVPVMHACGHDVHVAALIGTARLMAQARGRWHGTLLLIGQPSEELIDGARAMLADNLYGRFPKPDLILAFHDSADLPVGTVSVTAGPAMAMSTNLDVVVRGIGAHGSAPEQSRDPIVLAAAIVLKLQTIVSREISPFDPAVVTVGSIHGGTKRNIIPDAVKLEINMRSYTEPVRQHLIEAVQRIARGEAIAAGLPEKLMPVVTILENESAPVLFNDPGLTERVTHTLQRVLGPAQVRAVPRVMTSEDFGNFSDNSQIPLLMFRVGAVDPGTVAAAEAGGAALPTLHSALFAPEPAPTLRTGVVATVSAAIDLLQP